MRARLVDGVGDLLQVVHCGTRNNSQGQQRYYAAAASGSKRNVQYVSFPIAVCQKPCSSCKTIGRVRPRERDAQATHARALTLIRTWNARPRRCSESVRVLCSCVTAGGKCNTVVSASAPRRIAAHAASTRTKSGHSHFRLVVRQRAVESVVAKNARALASCGHGVPGRAACIVPEDVPRHMKLQSEGARA